MVEQMMLGSFSPELNQSLSQYHTPTKLARRMVEWAGVGNGCFVLEPSAGGGNIVRELIASGADVEAVEVDDKWANVLTDEFDGISIAIADFMKWTALDRYHLAVMNPPLDGGVGPSHIAHALMCAPRVVSVLRSQDLHGVDRHSQLWSNCDLARIAHCVRRPNYSGAGGKIETVVVDVYRKGTYHGHQSIVHWEDSWSSK